MTMKSVKEQKKKIDAWIRKGKNYYADVSTCAEEFYRDVLKSYGAVQQSNKK